MLVLTLVSAGTGPARGPPQTVLVVDDDPDILEGVRMLLESALGEVRIITAASGAAALERIRHEQVDLVISDYKMPGMNGLEFLSRVAAIAPHAARALISAFPDSVLGPQKDELAFFLPKPFDEDTLIHNSAAALGRA